MLRSFGIEAPVLISPTSHHKGPTWDRQHLRAFRTILKYWRKSFGGTHPIRHERRYNQQ
jgi:hypothetical protein